MKFDVSVFTSIKSEHLNNIDPKETIHFNDIEEAYHYVKMRKKEIISFFT